MTDDTNDGGTNQTERDPTFSLEYPCDWVDGIPLRGVLESRACGEGPTAHVGDIYYACEEHFNDLADFLDSDREEAA